MKINLTLLVAIVVALALGGGASPAEADLIFNLSAAPGGGTLFTAAGFSGSITALPPHPTIGNFKQFDIIFPFGFFNTPNVAAANYFDFSSTLAINGSVAPQVFALTKHTGIGDIIRLQNMTTIGAGPITSFTGSFVIPQIPFASLSLPASSSTYWLDYGYSAGLVTLNSGVAAVPEPSTFALLSFGTATVLAYRRRKRRQPAEQRE
jgi:hypothetical protein